MSDNSKQVHLTDKLGIMDVEALPPEGGCNLLCLSDRQLAIIRGFVFPFARWSTRTVLPIQSDLYQTYPDVLTEIQDELDDLDLQVNGGSTMSCNEIAAGLVQLAEAIAAGGGVGSGCTTNVYCGSGALGAIGGGLAPLPNEDILGPTPEPEPEIGVPPAGFDTWSEYRTYKCMAAWYIWSQLRAVAVANRLFAGVELTAAVVTPVILGVSAAWVTALTPVGFVVLVASILGLFAVSAYGFYAFDQWIDYYDTNKMDIICGLYTSNTGAAAIATLASWVENGIEFIVWDGLLAGLGETVGPIMDSILTGVITPQFVAPLFQLVVGVSVPEAVCTTCGSVDLLENGTFDTDITHWTPVTGCEWAAGGSLQMARQAGVDTYTEQTFDVIDAGTYEVYANGYTHTDYAGVLTVLIDGDVVLTWSGGDDGPKDTTVVLEAGSHTIKLNASYDVAHPFYCNWDDISIPGLPV